MQNTEQCYSHRETYKRQERVLFDMIKKPAVVRIYIIILSSKKILKFFFMIKIGGS